MSIDQEQIFETLLGDIKDLVAKKVRSEATVDEAFTPSPTSTRDFELDDLDHTIIFAKDREIPGSNQPRKEPASVDSAPHSDSEITMIFSSHESQGVEQPSNYFYSEIDEKTHLIGSDGNGDIFQSHIGTDSAAQLKIGSRLGRYVLDEVITNGATSTIYGAHHCYIQNEAIVKVLRQDIDVLSYELFIREAQALGYINHPSVVRIIDANVDSDTIYLVLEKVEGQSLADELQDCNTLSPSRALDLLEEMVIVLEKQESLGIIHCDIKPGNIFVRQDGRYCLMDYGICRVDKSVEGAVHLSSINQEDPLENLMAYTPAYAAPEQMESSNKSALDNRVDLFSLGVVVWQALTGKKPEVEYGEGGIPLRKQFSPLQESNQKIPRELQTIVEGLLEHEPKARYQSASELRRQIEQYRYEGKPPSPPYVGRVFVALPFRENFNLVYQTIQSASDTYRLEARRMDKLVMVDDIWGQIVQELKSAKVVIADFSSDGTNTINPNVVTEAAHARAIGKPLILITQGAPENIPFDWRHFQMLQYTSDEAGLNKLKEELIARIRFCEMNT